MKAPRTDKSEHNSILKELQDFARDMQKIAPKEGFSIEDLTYTTILIAKTTELIDKLKDS